VTPAPQRPDLPAATHQPLLRHDLRLESRPFVLAPRSSRIPARYRHIHQQRRRLTAARIVDNQLDHLIYQAPANEGFLKRTDLVTFIKI
jgi:hypothetical protein